MRGQPVRTGFDFRRQRRVDICACWQPIETKCGRCANCGGYVIYEEKEDRDAQTDRPVR